MKPYALSLLWLCLGTSAQAADYRQLDLAGSYLHFTSRQMGVPVDGLFRKFNASLAFDPAVPAQAKGQLRIDLASIDTGNREANEEVLGPQWFDVKRQPEASFELRQIQPLGADRFQVNGLMSLKGSSQPISFNTQLKASGKQAVMEGSFVLKRLDFKVGEGLWGDVGVVANEVTVQFHLLLGP
ncbi:Polyisoprenoid-binding protein YceI [Polaromonas sp. OV174]|uniref:YceI family protein n=1 Tax=Polaromonas sp. OV174 TaxID=1855300 RepID=UPI0008F1B1BE|nr:YceI family protein [Polaromonas sp. OV174]SFB85640.1 Polyisoprenoid-binding protein YceI [Polaromonas sp. OV174]